MGDDYMDDDEDYGFEYEDDSGSEPDVDMENQYYTAKGYRSDGKLDEAIKAFEKVLELEGDKGEWGFKALKQMIKITFGQNRLEKMLDYYRELLTYIKTAVTKNYSEKSINAILDYISTSRQMDLLQHFYETTLDALKDAKNERLWFKTNTKLGKLFFDLHEFGKLEKIVKQLKFSTKMETFLCEIIISKLTENREDSGYVGAHEGQLDSIMADPFIREHTEELMNNIRTQVLLRLIRPYTNVRISYLSKKLKVSEGEVIDLLVGAILDDGLEAKINEESGMIEMPKNKKKMTVSTLVVPNAGDSAAVKSDSKEGTSSSDGTSSSATQPILSGPPPTSCNQELSLEGLRLWADRIDSIQSSIAVYKKVM
ncbi:Protein CBR-CSN-2 [Caenorhabditis briggsae]|uniref:Protein CBR-CSN-2 n=1 Tax=Caenorhabditis briggsae TaxID=6238 RepID=A8Y1I7_CAEBR|nr:Protein CBR-CSN-2 [Caenorhabditis briggsae]CAP38756.2 Protein CBR-CSN-2 [Caenorhabditis briggsae]